MIDGIVIKAIRESTYTVSICDEIYTRCTSTTALSVRNLHTNNVEDLTITLGVSALGGEGTAGFGVCCLFCSAAAKDWIEGFGEAKVQAQCRATIN